MKPAETLGRLLRRWYIVVPGIVVAGAAALGAWNVVGPEYERTGTQMLLPGGGNLPEGVTNPFLYIGGLALPADVLVQSVGGQGALNGVLEDYPGIEVKIERASGSAPVIKTTVTDGSDEGAARALALVMQHNVDTLEQLQTTEGVPADSHIEIATLTFDEESTLLQRTRMVIAAVTFIGIVGIGLVLAALIDGLVRRRPRGSGRRATTADDEAGPAVVPEPEPDDSETRIRVT